MTELRTTLRPAVRLSLTLTSAALAGIGVTILAEHDISILLIGAIATALLAPILWKAASGGFDVFEPLNAFALAWAIMFVIRPIAMISNNDFSFYFAPAIDLRQSFDHMLLLALIGAIAFAVGYQLPVGRLVARKVPPPPRGWDDGTVIAICMAATAFGLALFGLFVIQAGGLSELNVITGGRSLAQYELLKGSNKYFLLGPVLLVGTTLVTWAIALDRRDPLLKFLALVQVVVVFIVWNSFGSRIVLFPLFAGMIICWYLQRGRRPRLLTLVVAGLVTLFLSAVILTERNSDIRKTEGKVQVAKDLLARPHQIFDPLTVGSDNSMAPGLAAAMALTPAQLPHTYGFSLLEDTVVRPIPRQIWPSKPHSPREQLISKLDPAAFENGTANPEFSNLLVFYLDFGIFGALALIVYGVIARAVYEWFLLNRELLAARLLFALSLPVMFQVARDSPVDAFAVSVIMAVPIWAAFWVSRSMASATGWTAQVR